MFGRLALRSFRPTFIGQQAGWARRGFVEMCPSSPYTPPVFDRPRYSLKRFNMQLAQSVFCRSPSLERTQVIIRVMNHDGVVGDHVTFYAIFSAIKVHRIYEAVGFSFPIH